MEGDAPDPISGETLDELDAAFREWSDHARCYRLTVDCYLASERCHEIGWILFEFNERVILDSDMETGWFVVIGSD
jgi:hypothetical protein